MTARSAPPAVTAASFVIHATPTVVLRRRVVLAEESSMASSIDDLPDVAEKHALLGLSSRA